MSHSNESKPVSVACLHESLNGRRKHVALARLVLRVLVRVAAAPEEQQVPDGEQASAGAAGEERDARLARLVRQRGQLVLRFALVQAARRRRHGTLLLQLLPPAPASRPLHWSSTLPRRACTPTAYK